MAFRKTEVGKPVPGTLGCLGGLGKRLTLDFRSGHDLTVVRSSLVLDSALNVGSAWDSPSSPPPLVLTCVLSKKKQKELAFR